MPPFLRSLAILAVLWLLCPPPALPQVPPQSSAPLAPPLLKLADATTVSPETAVATSPSFVRIRDTHAVNKKFLVAHAFLWGSLVYDGLVTQYGVDAHRCVEGTWITSGSTWYRGVYYPNGQHHFVPGRQYATLVPIYLGVTAGDWILRRKHVRVAPYAIPIALGVPHWIGGSEWFTQHCF